MVRALEEGCLMVARAFFSVLLLFCPITGAAIVTVCATTNRWDLLPLFAGCAVAGFGLGTLMAALD